MTPAEVVAAYTRANTELLGIGDAALVAYASADNRPNALACVVLLYAKEKTGIERARIGAGLAAQSISDDDRRALAALTSARTSYLHVFAATAPRPAEQLLDRALASASYAELTRMEELLLDGRETEIDLDARGWFNARDARDGSPGRDRHRGARLRRRSHPWAQTGFARRSPSGDGLWSPFRGPTSLLEIQRDVDLHHVVRRVGQRLVERRARRRSRGAGTCPCRPGSARAVRSRRVNVSMAASGKLTLLPIVDVRRRREPALVAELAAERQHRDDEVAGVKAGRRVGARRVGAGRGACRRARGTAAAASPRAARSACDRRRRRRRPRSREVVDREHRVVHRRAGADAGAVGAAPRRRRACCRRPADRNGRAAGTPPSRIGVDLASRTSRRRSG